MFESLNFIYVSCSISKILNLYKFRVAICDEKFHTRKELRKRLKTAEQPKQMQFA